MLDAVGAGSTDPVVGVEVGFDLWVSHRFESNGGHIGENVVVETNSGPDLMGLTLKERDDAFGMGAIFGFANNLMVENDNSISGKNDLVGDN